MDAQTIAQKRQDLFFQNLFALEFDIKAMSRQHKINFEKKMFCLPNRTAFEVVSHFLFLKLNKVSKKQYPIIWPLLDIKQHKEFQKTCFSHLSAISQESDLKFPGISPSVLSSYGDAFYELYFAFSTHVVVETNRRFNVPMFKRPREDNRFHESAIEVLKIATTSSVEKFRELVDISQQHLEGYVKCTKNLVAYVEKLKLSNASKQSLLDEKMKNAIALYSEVNCSLGTQLLERTWNKSSEYKVKVEQYWNCVEAFLSKEEIMWNSISSEIDDTHKKYILKGEEYNIPIPDIVQECCTESMKTELPNETKDLCILRFLKLLKIILEFYINSIKKGSFSKTYMSGSLSDVSKLEHLFKKTQSLSELLENANMLTRNYIEGQMDSLYMGEELMENNEKTFYEDLPPSPTLICNFCDPQMLTSNEFTSFFETHLATELCNMDLIKDEVKEENNETDVLNICHDSTLTQSSDCANSFSPSFASSYQHSYSENSCHTPLHKTLMGQTLGIMDETPKLKIPSAESVISSAAFTQHLDELENSISANSTKFHMRESWLLEESLNAQTLSESLSFME